MIMLLTLIMMLAFILVPISIIGYVIYLNNERKQLIELSKPKKVERPTRSESELTKVLYDSIEREWTYRVRFHFKLKKIVQPDFEWELDYLTKRVINSLAPGIREELGYYYTENALVLLVSHMVQILLLDYLDKNRAAQTTSKK